MSTVCAVLVLSLSACATPSLLAANRPPAPVFESGDICDPDAQAGGVPDRFDAVAAYLCDHVLTPAPVDPNHTPPPLDIGPHGGTAPTVDSPEPAPAEPEPTPRRFEGDLAPLLATLSMPDKPLTDGVCPAVMVVPPDVRLLDDRGRWVRPAIPTDACSQPEREAIVEAFARLTPAG